jgi:excisionase family DNA binding protein
MGGDFMEDDTFSRIDEKYIMTVREVAQYLRLSRAKVYRLAKAGKIPAMRIGRFWRFRKDMIDDWFRQCIRTDLEPSIY